VYVMCTTNFADLNINNYFINLDAAILRRRHLKLTWLLRLSGALISEQIINKL
jgi:hypothetical protein